MAVSERLFKIGRFCVWAAVVLALAGCATARPQRLSADEAGKLLNTGVMYHNQADALFTKGELRPDSDCVKKAVKAYDAFLKRFPDDPQASNVLMKTGLIYQNSGQPLKAIGAYDEFLKRFPKDPQAANVRNKRDALRQAMLNGSAERPAR